MVLVETPPLDVVQTRGCGGEARRSAISGCSRSRPRIGQECDRRNLYLPAARRYRVPDTAAASAGDHRPRRSPGGTANAPVDLANLSGFPDLIVPAGFTGDGLPVTISFLGPAFSEPRLLAVGYSFEQATHARRLPIHTPLLKDQVITLPGR